MLEKANLEASIFRGCVREKVLEIHNHCDDNDHVQLAVSSQCVHDVLSKDNDWFELRCYRSIKDDHSQPSNDMAWSGQLRHNML